MISKLKLYEVTNTSNSPVGRGGYVVPPKSTVKVRTSEYKIKQFQASVVLKLKEVTESDKEPASTENEKSKYLVNEEGRFPCPHCDKDYKKVHALEKHIEDKHPEEVEEIEAGDE